MSCQFDVGLLENQFHFFFFLYISSLIVFIVVVCCICFSIKFRLDDTSDITWYNDLVSPLPETKDCDTCCDSASVLFSCETFEVNENNPRLIFGAFAGHSIEFNVSFNYKIL